MLVLPGNGSSLVFNFSVNQYPQVFISQLQQAKLGETNLQYLHRLILSPLPYLALMHTISCIHALNELLSSTDTHSTVN